MTAGTDPNSDPLMDELRHTAAEVIHEDPPPEFVGAVRALPAVVSLDLDIALLTHDSFVDGTPSGLRGGPSDARRLRFDGADTALDLEVAGDGASRRLVGQVIPPRILDLELRSLSGTQHFTTDETGSFLLTDLPAEPITLHWPAQAGHLRGRTQWLAF